MFTILSRSLSHLVPSLAQARKRKLKPVRMSLTSPSNLLNQRSLSRQDFNQTCSHTRSLTTSKKILQALPSDVNAKRSVHKWQENDYLDWLNSTFRTLRPEDVPVLAKILVDYSFGLTKETLAIRDIPQPNVDCVFTEAMMLWDTDAIRSWLEDKALEVINQSTVNLDFNLEVIQKKQVTEQKKYLKNLFKQPIWFNPLSSKVDLRFLTSQVNDEVYNRFLVEAKNHNPKHYYLLSAVSGGGKTVKEGHGWTKQELTLNVTMFCQVFWLSKLLILQYMRKNNKIRSPEEWIFWSNTGGSTLLIQVQEKLLRVVKEKLAHGSLAYLLLQAALDKILTAGLGAQDEQITEEKPIERIWIAVDEAQVAFHSQQLKFQSLSKESELRPFLFPLVVYGLPAKACRIVAGTHMSEFDEIIKSGAAKGSTVFSLSDSKYNHPYVDFTTAWNTINKFVDLTGVNVSHSAEDALQGRLRYVYRFIAEVGDAAKEKSMKTQASDFSPEEKQEIFDTALCNLEANIKKYSTKRFFEVYNCLDPILQSKLLNHIVVLIESFVTKKRATWNVDEFAKEYLAAPEDLGFLFLSKKKDKYEYYYVYSIQEPSLIGVLLSIEEVQAALQKFRFHQTLLSINTNDFNQAQMGYIMERAMQPFFIKPANRLKVLIDTYAKDQPSSWYHTATFNWYKIVQATGRSALPDIKAAVAYLKAHKSALLSCKNAGGANKESLQKQAVTLLQKDRFLAQSTLINANQLPDFLIDELINAIESEGNKAGEILFMAIKPLEMLLKPSNEIGPDALGYFTFQQQGQTEIGMFTFSVSRKDEEDDSKYHKNERNTDPENFYEKYVKKTMKYTIEG